MLSVAEASKILGVTPSRVRALVAAGLLPATKVGRAWAIREEDVLQRLSEHRRAGRPAEASSLALGFPADQGQGTDAEASTYLAEGHELYDACKRYFACRPDAEQLRNARSREEAAFYEAVADFFLQSRQRELVKQGVF